MLNPFLKRTTQHSATIKHSKQTNLNHKILSNKYKQLRFKQTHTLANATHNLTLTTNQTKQTHLNNNSKTVHYTKQTKKRKQPQN